MLALGVPDARLAALPGLVGDLLDDDDSLLVGHAGGLADEVRRDVRAALGGFAEMCRRLADAGIPATLQHDDLHDANVFVSDPSTSNRASSPRPPPGRPDVRETERVADSDDPSGDLQVTGSVVVPAAAQNWRFSRSSGPGGQGVNTADSRVELSVAVLELPGLSDAQLQRLTERLGTRLVDGVLTIAASEHRQQLRNRQAARERLAAVLRAALAPPPRARRRTKPTRGSQERRIEAKKQRGQLKKQRRTWD
jgi:ribosome-associated protein